jgi:hypothetical protein
MSWAQHQLLDLGDVWGECKLASGYLGPTSLSPILMRPLNKRGFMLQRTIGNGSGRPPPPPGVIDGSDNTMPVSCTAENNQLDAALPIRALLDKGKWQRDQSINRSSPKLL